MALYNRAVASIPFQDILTSTILTGDGVGLTTVNLALSDGSFLELDGAGLTVLGGKLTSGTLTELQHKSGGVTLETLSDVDIAAADFQGFLTPVPNGSGLIADLLNASDELTGSPGNDSLAGFASDDTLYGRSGNDTLDGGNGFDYASYKFSLGTLSVNANLITGLAIDAVGDTDHLISIEGLIGSRNSDVLIGDDADNVFRGYQGADHIEGGAGFDTLQFISRNDATDPALAEYLGSGGSVVNLALGTAKDQFGNIDTFTSIERVEGTTFGDSFTGSGADEVFVGYAGPDTIDGAGGKDRVSYSNDVNFGGSLPVIVNLSTQALALGGIVLAAGTARDSFGAIDTLTNIENVSSGGQNDTLVGNNGDNVLDGRGGADVYVGLQGNDTLVGGGGGGSGDGPDTADYHFDAQFGGTFGILVNQRANVSSANGVPPDTVIDGFGTTDSIVGIRHIIATDFADDIRSGGRANYIDARAGADFVDGFEDNDTVVGGAGNDTLDGGADTDRAVYSGALADYAVGSGAAGELLIQDVRVGSPDGLDLTKNFEIYVFADQAVSKAALLAAGLPTFSANTTGGFNYSVSHADNPGLGSGGVDTLYFTGDGHIDLPTSIENFVYSGFGSVDVTGNDTSNAIVGGNQGDTLSGGGGDDVLVGWTGDDALVGGDGNDRLYGGPGADTMTGGKGDDFYRVEDAGDVVIELTDQGYDRITASIGNFSVQIDDPTHPGLKLSFSGYALDAAVESLSLTGNSGLDAAGNNLDNGLVGDASANIMLGKGGDDMLAGNGGDDFLDGGAGRNRLDGGGGNDTLLGGSLRDTLSGGAGDDWIEGRGGNDLVGGGAGSDLFVFAAPSAANVTRITDFAAGDTVAVHGSDFGLPAGLLGSDRLVDGGPTLAQGQFVYKASGLGGSLIWDADGTGSGSGIVVATFDHGASLAGSFLVI